MFTLVLLALTALADDARGEQLAELRAEVDGLRDEVQRDRAELQARLDSLRRARGELDLELSRETLALERLQLSLTEAREASGGTEAQFVVLVPVLERGIAALRERITQGLPFRRAERLGALDELETALQAGTLPPDKIASRIWQSVEDELALTRENAIDRQVITLDGKEHLCEVARLGMVALYFRTENGVVGWAERDGSWTRAEGRTATAQINELFTALERRVRTGWFDLPGGLPEVPR